MSKIVNVEVKNRHTRDVLWTIKKFMRKVKDEGIMQELRDRMYYEKPSVTRRKKKLRRKRTMEKLRREQDK